MGLVIAKHLQQQAAEAVPPEAVPIPQGDSSSEEAPEEESKFFDGLTPAEFFGQLEPGQSSSSVPAPCLPGPFWVPPVELVPIDPGLGRRGDHLEEEQLRLALAMSTADDEQERRMDPDDGGVYTFE